VLLAQLERLAEQVERRNENVTHFDERVAQIDGVSTLRLDDRQANPLRLRHRPSLRRAGLGGISRDRFARALHAEGIRLYTSFYTPVYKTPLFAWRDAPIEVDYSQTHCPVASGPRPTR